ncbi:MAG TPA: nitroreductase [Dehalococcoidia bacterium]|nr:nitroreductase [Dehalococcoidia bacterium]
MEIPLSRWHAAIPRRKSRRLFDPAGLEPGVLAQLETLCREFRPFPQARAELTTQLVDRVLRGIVGSYAKVRGAPALIAFIGDMNDRHVQEKVGYTGEGIILEATAMGLDTCWVGGLYRPKTAASVFGIGINEKVISVTPVGRALERRPLDERMMTAYARSHRRKPLSKLVTGLNEAQYPRWIKASLEAARLAPSAVNRQPWRFHVEPDSITVSAGPPRITYGISKRLDCGIAMLHIEVAAMDCGVRGTWEFLDPPRVARFTVTGGG